MILDISSEMLPAYIAILMMGVIIAIVVLEAFVTLNGRISEAVPRTRDCGNGSDLMLGLAAGALLTSRHEDCGSQAVSDEVGSDS